MRALFGLLLLANLVLAVWAMGYFGKADEGREPERLGRQLNPERLQVRQAPEAAAREAAAPPPATATCRRLSGLSGDEASSLARALAGLPGWQVNIVAAEAEPTQHWVVIPGLPTRAVAEKKQEELRQLGVTGYQVVEHPGHGPVAVSFATLADEAAANDLLQKLQRKGVRSARVIALPAVAGQAADIRAPGDVLMQKLPDLIALFPAASVGECAAP